MPGSGPANSGPLTVRRNGTAVTVAARGSTARVTTADLVAGAGVVHVVDAVLLPFYTTLLEVSAWEAGAEGDGGPGAQPVTSRSIGMHYKNLPHGCAIGARLGTPPKATAGASDILRAPTHSPYQHQLMPSHQLPAHLHNVHEHQHQRSSLRLGRRPCAIDKRTPHSTAHVVALYLGHSVTQAVTSNPELPFLATLLKSFNLYVEVLADPTLTYTLLAPSGRIAC